MEEREWKELDFKDTLMERNKHLYRFILEFLSYCLFHVESFEKLLYYSLSLLFMQKFNELDREQAIIGQLLIEGQSLILSLCIHSSILCHSIVFA